MENKCGWVSSTRFSTIDGCQFSTDDSDSGRAIMYLHRILHRNHYMELERIIAISALLSFGPMRTGWNPI